MSAWSSTRKIAIITAGALTTGVAGYYVFSKPERVEKILESRRVHNSWTTSYTPSALAKWDDNWDQ